MKIIRTFISVLMSVLVFSGIHAQNVTFVPQWTPQAQFAGFYAAKEKGFYEEEGLNVSIVHVGLNTSAFEMLEAGRAQICGMQVLQMMVERSAGAKLVNVMQVTQRTGLCCVSHSPIRSISDLAGKRLGYWRVGFSEICRLMAANERVDVNWIPTATVVNSYVYGAVDATLCYSYSELLRLKLATGDIPESNILRFSDVGYDIPEDALVVTESYWNSNRETVEKFVRATRRGWDWVRENRKEALAITAKYVEAAHVITNDVQERTMLDEYLNLQVNPRTGRPDYAPMKEPTFRNLMNELYNSGMASNRFEYKDLIVYGE